MHYIFDSSLIRHNDVGGAVGQTLSDADAFVLGLSFGTTVIRRGGRVVAVAKDERGSSASLASALSEGLSRTGCDVIHVGAGPLPMLRFALRQVQADAGAMVGGGHYPANWNGFRLMFDHGPLHGDTLRSLAALAARGDWETGKGSVSGRPFEDAYAHRLRSGYRGGAFTVAWHCGSAAARSIVGKLIRCLPGDHHLLPDESAHRPSGKQASFAQNDLAVVRHHVLTEGCDVGFALDGAGDTIIAIDGLGRALWRDQIAAILARSAFAERGQAGRETDGQHGILFAMWNGGHSLIKPRAKQVNADFAGELSGDIQSGQPWQDFDDSLFTALRLLEAIQTSGGSLADIVNDMPVVHSSPELHFSVPPNRKLAVVAEIRQRLHATGLAMDAAEVVRVSRPQGQWLIWPSDSADLLVGRAEAATETGLASLVSDMCSAVGFSVAPIPVNLPRIIDPAGMMIA